jgi:hypothetical protein
MPTLTVIVIQTTRAAALAGLAGSLIEHNYVDLLLQNYG